jgi:hypothetical protein
MLPPKMEPISCQSRAKVDQKPIPTSSSVF